MGLSTFISSIQLSTRAACSAGIAVAVAQFPQLPDTLYALIGAVIVTDLSPLKTQELALQRCAGTVLGAVVGAVFSEFLTPSPWVIGAGVFVAMFFCHFLLRQGAEKVTGYVCGILVLDHAAQAWLYAGYRLLETLIGIGAAVLVSFVPKLLREDLPGQR